jgi:RHS repeat-associated protein
MTDQVTIDGHAYTSMYTVDPHTIAYTSPEGRQAIATLDERGRVISFARDGLDTITFSYDGRGRLATAAQGARSFDYIYDATGMAASVTDAAGRQTHYAYTPSNHLAQTTLPGGELFTFGYDADGNLAEVIPPLGANHAMTYTPVDRLASYTPPDGITAAWSYNADHELTGASLPGDIQEVYGLDGAGRIEEFSYPGTTVSFAYSDQTDRIAEITRIAVVGTQSIGFTYNGASLISANWSGVANGAYTYTYGSDLQLNNITLDGGSQIALSRDADGLLTSYGPITFIRAGPGGDPTQISSGPLDIVYAYNPLAEFSERSITVSGQALYREQMTFDESGRLTQKIDTWLGDQRNYSYTYDADGQLLSIMLDGDTSEQYGYDANGNRTSRKLETSPLETATYDSQDRIVQQGALNYQFDAAGFLTGRGSDTFTYSTRGELVQARVGGQTINYAYDGFGRRVSRADSAGVYQYLYGNPDNPFQLTAARDPSGVLSEFYYDEGSRLLAIQRAGIWYYAASDFLGTPRVIADSSGSVVKSLAFDGFGRQVSDSNPGFILPVGFAGGLADMATGLVRFGLRDYDPEAGRWTARDPVLFDGRQSNLYVYASNNPVQLADPLGLFSFGMSAYEGVGGGFSVSFTSVGFSWCGELGLGIGKSVGVDPFGDLEEAGGSLNLELGGSVGFLSGSLGYSEKTKGGGLSGCPGKFSPEFCAGPFCTSGNNLKVSGDPGNRKSSISDLFKATGVDMQAKMTYKHCAQFKW